MDIRILKTQLNGLGIKAPAAPVALTGDYTLKATDSGKLFTNASGAAITVTVPYGLPEDFTAEFVEKPLQGDETNTSITLAEASADAALLVLLRRAGFEPATSGVGTCIRMRLYCPGEEDIHMYIVSGDLLVTPPPPDL